MSRDLTAQEVLSRCNAAYRDCKQLSCTGGQTVSSIDQSGRAEVSFRSRFEIDYVKPNLFFYSCGKVDGKGFELWERVVANHGGTSAYWRFGDKPAAMKSIPEAIGVPCLGEGPYFVLERLFEGAEVLTGYSVPLPREMSSATLSRRERLRNIDCYVLTATSRPMNMWPGGTATVWIAADRFFVLKVLIEGRAGENEMKLTRETDFRYDRHSVPGAWSTALVAP